MALCWVILRGQQFYTVIQALHSLLYIVAKYHFFSVVTWKDIIKYLQKCEGCTHFCEILCVYIYIKRTGHFIRYTLLVPGWTPFCLQNCLNSSWHGFNKMLETFLRDFGPYWHDSITQLLQICQLHIHDANLPFNQIPKVLYWTEIWWPWRPFE